VNGLFRAEVLRLTSRRLVRVLAVVFLGVLLLVQVVAAARSHSDEESMRRATAEAYEEHQAGVEMCLRDQEAGTGPSDVVCEGGQPIPYDTRYRADENLPNMANGLAVASALVAFVVGASYIGADWHAGTMQSLLFWEPRRQRVVLVKALALVTVLLAFTAVVQAVGWATTMLVASTRGTTAGVTSGLHQSAFLTMLRGMLVVTFSGLLGYAVSGLARLTGAALGAAFAYFAIVENVVRGLRPGWARFLVTENVTALLTKSMEVPPASSTRFDDYYFSERFYVLTGVRGAVTLGIYLVLLVGLFALTFNRRDVT
jgi:ABC-type transport system involved in multi-copper enzyme maturation permease subunit